MKHVYGADKFFTNGQILVSMLRDEEGFELGIHKKAPLKLAGLKIILSI